MSIARKDWLRRLIEQLAQALATIAGLRRSGQLVEAEMALKQAERELLGPLARDAERLDSESLKQLLSADERVRLYAELLIERAELRSLRGDLAGAALDRLRAAELGHIDQM